MIEIIKSKDPVQANILISGSKSISNRVILLNHILQTQKEIQNCSDSEDSKNLIQALHLISKSHAASIDVKHAGTNMRFLTAYLSALPGDWILSGSERMKQRPIKELVDALKQIGAQIEYQEKEGFPPLRIMGQNLTGHQVKLKANISSQFISALLLMSPLLKNGLELELEGEAVSKPYIQMSIAILKDFGFEIEQNKNRILVNSRTVKETTNQAKTTNFTIESDWSSASYWYSICALSKNSRISLSTFNTHSLQADSVLEKIYKHFGVRTIFEEGKITLMNEAFTSKYFEYDFMDCPDIAQTVAVTCLGLGIEAKLTGLSTLKIKETDRIVALKTELEKLGASVVIDHASIHILPNVSKGLLLPTVQIATYNDHRMALSFAPLALISKSIVIDEAQVIDKSYAHFWDDLKSAGFSVNLTP